MPASKKNRENLKKAVAQAYEGSNAQKRIKEIARQKMEQVKKEKASTPPPVKKSRAYNRAVAQRALAKLKEKNK